VATNAVFIGGGVRNRRMGNSYDIPECTRSPWAIACSNLNHQLNTNTA
jgi:hypothetical protein